MKRPLVCALIVMAALLPTRNALAVGTAAGTNITNQATATYTVGATTGLTETSNMTTSTVDELLNVTVVSQDGSPVTVNPSNTNEVLTFLVTNTGNGTEAFTLDANSDMAGDDFNPTLVNVYLDDGNDNWDGTGTETLYNPGTNDPSLAADADITVFVLNDIPGSLNDGDEGYSELTADANTITGASTAGTVYSGAGDGGVDAVVGNTFTNNSNNDYGTYLVSSVVVTAVKSSANILDPLAVRSRFPVRSSRTASKSTLQVQAPPRM